jgi:arylsulfatase A-like enzyme
MVLMVPGVVVAVLNRLRPGLVPVRAAVWLFAALAIWGPLLRMPLYGAASLLVAAGVGRRIGGAVAARAPRFERFAGRSLLGLLGLLGLLMAATSGRRALAEFRAEARLPAPPPGARNVLLLVLDTVRAESLGLYGYPRDTTPHLARWAKKGVQFDWALAPSPWTFPSHSSFFTGQWPYKLASHWQLVLDEAHPTLAEFLRSRGYRTGGFAANTSFCSYETGLDRGFGHYEDYPLSPSVILGSTVPGRWLLTHVLNGRGAFGVKWIRSQSRDARGINRAFLDWLRGGGSGERPFFAFLNYLDAHEPFVVPKGHAGRFGLRPASDFDEKMLLDYWDLDKLALGERDIALVRDSYDDCIAYLDRQIGTLLEELDGRGVLRNTVVIITSDHGEQFGEHGVFNHGYSLYLHEVRVPLLIVAPSAPTGRAVSGPISLRDLPATVVDLAGVAEGSPFPGHSLAAHWREAADPSRPLTSPALSEVAVPVVLAPQRGRGPTQRGYAMSLVADGRHYILDSAGTEELYAVQRDPGELRDTKSDANAYLTLSQFETSLLEILIDDPVTRGGASGDVERFRRMLESRIYGWRPDGRSGRRPRRGGPRRRTARPGSQPTGRAA